jgi:F0F1-type ATP synthase assembly protein I
LSKDPLSDLPKKSNVFLRFSSAGIQMAGIIAFFSWLGTYLDKKYQTQTPWWTIGLSLFGVIAAIAIIIREVINMSKENDK